MKSFRFCRDYTTINLGIQFDWGIIRDEFVVTVNCGFWSFEFVFNKKVNVNNV